jgi:hypothetical protein
MVAGTLKTADVVLALTTKGAARDKTHHLIFRRFVDGKLAAVTRVSPGEREIGRPRQALMARQCLLTTAQFGALVDCTFSADDWEDAIRHRR